MCKCAVFGGSSTCKRKNLYNNLEFITPTNYAVISFTGVENPHISSIIISVQRSGRLVDPDSLQLRVDEVMISERDSHETSMAIVRCFRTPSATHLNVYICRTFLPCVEICLFPSRILPMDFPYVHKLHMAGSGMKETKKETLATNTKSCSSRCSTFPTHNQRLRFGFHSLATHLNGQLL